MTPFDIGCLVAEQSGHCQRFLALAGRRISGLSHEISAFEAPPFMLISPINPFKDRGKRIWPI
jgi:hypothetical protein